MRAHYADFQKSKESYNHAYPQQKQPTTYVIHPGTSQEKGGNRNEEEMYQVCGLEMAMKRFVDSTTIAVFGSASLDRLVRIKK
jgi:hypothetical protein